MKGSKGPFDEQAFKTNFIDLYRNNALFSQMWTFQRNCREIK